MREIQAAVIVWANDTVPKQQSSEQIAPKSAHESTISNIVNRVLFSLAIFNLVISKDLAKGPRVNQLVCNAAELEKTFRVIESAERCIAKDALPLIIQSESNTLHPN